jgi:hypothetical protein
MDLYFSNAPFGSLELNFILIIVILAYINYDNPVLCKIYLYAIISKMLEIFMCYIFTMEE